MPEQLKHFFSPEVVRRIAGMIEAVHPLFPQKKFVKDASFGLEELELLPRAWHIAHALHEHLPQEFARGAAILKASLGPRLANTEGNGMSSFLYLPHVCYVAKYGIGDLETSLGLQYELTKRFTAEFSIRVFLEQYPEQTLARLREWAHDSDVHVRRLVSEGTRPRLPWAPRLRMFQKDPGPVLELLELLKDDPELYVRRSVANSLNDIGKDYPELLLQTCRRWLIGASEERRWLVQHALRSAVKRGEAGALQVLGYGKKAAARVEGVKVSPRRVGIGECVTITFDIASTAIRKQALLIDLRVAFVKANGQTAPKVFKLKKLELFPGHVTRLSTKISLRQMTTRKHYPGKHRFEVIVNGTAMPAGEFLVTK
ncbi:MAG: DNA alkylation repair protein [Candidatus Korobacteraceae bacterium]